MHIDILPHRVIYCFREKNTTFPYISNTTNNVLVLAYQYIFLYKMSPFDIYWHTYILTLQMLTLLEKYISARASVQKHGTANVWPWYLKWLEHSACIRSSGVRVALRSRYNLSQKLWHFHKNICSYVENEWCCPRTVNMSNVNFTSKMYTL